MLDRFGKSLRKDVNDLSTAPLPERWVELIKRLDAAEKASKDSNGKPD